MKRLFAVRDYKTWKFFESKKEAKKFRDSDQSIKDAKVYRGPDHWRGSTM